METTIIQEGQCGGHMLLVEKKIETTTVVICKKHKTSSQWAGYRICKGRMHIAHDHFARMPYYMHAQKTTRYTLSRPQ